MLTRFTPFLSLLRAFPSLFRDVGKLAGRRSRLTLAAVASVLAAVTAVLAGLSATCTPTAGAAGTVGPGPVSHATRTAGRNGAPTPESVSARPAADHRQPGAAHRPPAHTRPASGDLLRRPIAPQLYLIYDSTTPSALPRRHAIAVYADGGYVASRRQVAGRRHVLWIDTNGRDPAASALDVEPGDATPSVAARWARSKLYEEPHSLARIYTMRSEWQAVRHSINRLPSSMRLHVRWWIADPTGVPHIVPGSQATQWYWGPRYDISTASPRF